MSQERAFTSNSLSPGSIGGRHFDLFFFFLGPLFGALIGVVLLAFPALVVPAWWLWLWLGDGPHLFATYSRTYLDPKERKERRGLLVKSLLWLSPGVLAFGAMKLSGERVFFDLFLLFASIWSLHHGVRQYYGLMSIFSRHEGKNPKIRRIDTVTLYGLFWGSVALFLLGHPFGRKTLELPENIPGWGTWALYTLAALLGLWGLLYASFVLWRVLRRVAARPGVFVLSRVFIQAFAFFVIGAFEPLYPNPADPEQFFLAVAVITGVGHSLEYLGIVFATNRRRYEARDGSLASRLGKSPLFSYLLWLSAGLLYLALVAARGTSPEVSLFPLGSDLGHLCIALYWGVFFHHYYLDQKIWRPHQDKALRFELGLSEAL